MRSWQYHKRVSSSFYIQGVTSSGTFMPINITNEAKNGRSLFLIPLSPIFSWCGRRRQQFHASHELDPLTNLSRRQKKLSEHTGRAEAGSCLDMQQYSVTLSSKSRVVETHKLITRKTETFLCPFSSWPPYLIAEMFRNYLIAMAST